MPKAQKLPTGYVDSVTRDNKFFYNIDSGFYVEVNGRRYARDTPEHLHSLVTRELTGREDESGAYYTAQLIHYGLDLRKTKPAMKNVLLAAFEKTPAGSFDRPKRLHDLEASLKRLWTAENKKAHLRHQEEKEKEEKVTPRATARKRKNVDSESGPAPKRAKGKERAKTEEKAKSKGKAKGTGKSEQLSHIDVEGKFIINSPKLVAESSYGSDHGFELTLARSNGNMKHLWGSFDFGAVRGIIRGGLPPRTVGDTVVFKWRGEETGEGQMTYGDGNHGTLTFLGNGKIRGNITGGFIGSAAFSGELNPAYAGRPTIWSMNVKGWKGRWRGINQRASEAANASRWGGWHPDRDYKERGVDSDTTIAGEDMDEDERGW